MKQSYLLYHAPGACSCVVMACLNELEVPYETRLVNLGAREQREPEFLKINPVGKVPVLIHSGSVITETPSILLFLAERHKERSLLPLGEGIEGYISIVSILSWFASGVHPTLSRIRVPGIFGSDLKDIWTKASDAMHLHFALIENRLSQHAWFLGDHLTAFDFYAYWAWYRAVDAGLDASPYTYLPRHARELEKRKSVKAMLDADNGYRDQLGRLGYSFRPQFVPT